MDNCNDKSVEETNGITNIARTLKTMEWSDNITVIDLSHRKIIELEDKVVFPTKLCELNLSHNHFVEIPSAVLNLECLKSLDVSFNNIQYFDDTPNFCHSIETLNLSNNQLRGPPYWVWYKTPSKLEHMDLSNNIYITTALEDCYFKELLQYTTLVTNVKLYNCRLSNAKELLRTFPKVKVLDLGTPDLQRLSLNNLSHVPCIGLDKCCDIEKLNVSNTEIYTINSNINIYSSLIEINLSQNYINSLPKEFCLLENLEICILSCNNLLYLPEDMVKLKKLTCLRIDSNELCMLPNVTKMEKLKILDVYDNSLYEVPEELENIEELDLARNYLEEPTDDNYLEKREKLRLNIAERQTGRKQEEVQCSNAHSPCTTDDEELIQYMNNPPEPITVSNQASSPEDWDSDDYWVPSYHRWNTPPSYSSWMQFVKRKMDEGNFCPMDMHTISISEQVKYWKLCYPATWSEEDGQFDDCSCDES